MLMHTLRACYRLLTQGIFYHRQMVFNTPGARDRLLSQHVAIHDAILAGDPVDARRAAEAHIDYIVEAMREAQRSGEWARVSRLRLLQREGRN